MHTEQHRRSGAVLKLHSNNESTEKQYSWSSVALNELHPTSGALPPQQGSNYSCVSTISMTAGNYLNTALQFPIWQVGLVLSFTTCEDKGSW